MQAVLGSGLDVGLGLEPAGHGHDGRGQGKYDSRSYGGWDDAADLEHEYDAGGYRYDGCDGGDGRCYGTDCEEEEEEDFVEYLGESFCPAQEGEADGTKARDAACAEAGHGRDAAPSSDDHAPPLKRPRGMSPSPLAAAAPPGSAAPGHAMAAQPSRSGLSARSGEDVAGGVVTTMNGGGGTAAAAGVKAVSGTGGCGALWACRVCTYAGNRALMLRCEVCDCPRGSREPPARQQQEQALVLGREAQQHPHTHTHQQQQQQVGSRGTVVGGGSAAVGKPPRGHTPRGVEAGAGSGSRREVAESKGGERRGGGGHREGGRVSAGGGAAGGSTAGVRPLDRLWGGMQSGAVRSNSPGAAGTPMCSVGSRERGQGKEGRGAGVVEAARERGGGGGGVCAECGVLVAAAEWQEHRDLHAALRLSREAAAQGATG